MARAPARIAIAGGGTGGHTSAGLAVAALLPRLAPVEVHWLGSRQGIEARRVPEAGLPFHPVPAGKLRRYWDWQTLPDLALRVPAGVVASWFLLRRLRPRVLFGTGGFVSVPPALAARALAVPVVIHEQTAVPGLANRLLGRFAVRVALTFPLARPVFAPERVVLTGNPLRPELLGGSREEGCRLFGLDPAEPLAYVTGGSQGAHRINRTVGAALPALLGVCQVIHQSGDHPGTGDLAWLAARAAGLPPALRRRYALRPYLGPELRHVYAAADLVVGRSGAGTVNECCQLGLPALYIPLPGGAGGEQAANAALVAAAGGARVLPQSGLTPEELVGAVSALLADRAGLEAMGRKARGLARPDAAERLARLILEAGGL